MKPVMFITCERAQVRQYAGLTGLPEFEVDLPRHFWLHPQVHEPLRSWGELGAAGQLEGPEQIAAQNESPASLFPCLLALGQGISALVNVLNRTFPRTASTRNPRFTRGGS
jgi:hypothetical protein